MLLPHQAKLNIDPTLSSKITTKVEVEVSLASVTSARNPLVLLHQRLGHYHITMIKHRNDNTRIPIKISNVASDYRKNISKSVTAEKQIYVIHAHAQKPIFSHTFAAQQCAKIKGISGIFDVSGGGNLTPSLV